MANLPRTRTDALRKLEAIGEIFRDIEGHVESNVDRYFRPPATQWQPSDHSADFSSENEDLAKRREMAMAVTLDELIVLVGDTITEDALPTYSAWLSRMVHDPTGAGDHPMAVAARRWYAEERRHGAMLDRHLLLDPRINMRQVDLTTHYLIQDGFDNRASNPLEGFVYTSFQERATWISHLNLGKRIGSNNPYLRDASFAVARDEKRHEEYYKKVLLAEIFRRSPELAIEAYANMMRETIVMPAVNMGDGEDDSLFDKFAMVAQKIGVYTANDYSQIVEHLNEQWGIKNLKPTGDEARADQEYVLSLPSRMQRASKRIEARMANFKTPSFSWLNYDRV